MKTAVEGEEKCGPRQNDYVVFGEQRGGAMSLGVEL